ncbi:unnamed protein product [Trichobilharzia szidati]|nr:unnamed protein product [Trichobilharzia szidati]
MLYHPLTTSYACCSTDSLRNYSFGMNAEIKVVPSFTSRWYILKKEIHAPCCSLPTHLQHQNTTESNIKEHSRIWHIPTEVDHFSSMRFAKYFLKVIWKLFFLFLLIFKATGNSCIKCRKVTIQ